jgi:hypothetical protein
MSRPHLVWPLTRSQFLYRDRFNLSAKDGRSLVVGAPVVPGGPVAIGGPFAGAWRNYIRAVFKKGFMYTLSCKPSVYIYSAENRTLAGREARSIEGEASGRKMVIAFFEASPGPGGLVQRVDRTNSFLKQHLLSLAELLQTIGGFDLPLDPDRTAANSELLLETEYQNLELRRSTCILEPAAPGLYMFSLGNEVHAETVFAFELGHDNRTKMALARCLQSKDHLVGNETLQSVWNLTLEQLQNRTAALLPAPEVPLCLGAPPVGRGRGRGVPLGVPPVGRGRGVPPVGRGRGVPPVGRGRGRGRAR